MNRLRIAFIIFLLIGTTLISCKKEEVPTIKTSEITDITGTTAVCGGTIIAEGSGTVIARGVCWSIDITPSIEDNKTSDGAGAGSFTSNLAGLNGGSTFYVRAYATNSIGTGYGMAMSFTTLGQAPNAITQQATNITTTDATLNGTVNANYLSTNVTFEYGTTTSYGQTITANQNPVTGNLNTETNSNITGLLPGTTYHFRLKTVNSLGTVNGNDMTFSTLGEVPSASINAPTSITSTSAVFNGTVNPNYLSTVITFEYGTTLTYGSSIVAPQSPLTGNTSTNVSANLSGLIMGTIYHYRIKATNSLGTCLSNDMTFNTKVVDIDGNLYNIVKIGNQVWMAENLKTTNFNDGTNINLITDNSAWDVIFTNKLTTPAYCYYDNVISNKGTYGALYNWYTVNTATNGNKNICPTGWHVTKYEELDILFTYLGGNVVFLIYGGKLKEIGTTHWASPNTGATNETGFTALPGGGRGVHGDYYNLGKSGGWWCTHEENADRAGDWGIGFDSDIASKSSSPKEAGFSIRCIKD